MNYQENVSYNIYEQLQQLETLYADALADGLDSYNLSILWEGIKELREEIQMSSKQSFISYHSGQIYPTLSASL